jgi:ribonucleoside-diphosphate reductase alpha chain
MQTYSYGEVEKACLEYFGGDLLAASTVAKKYLMRNKEGAWLEKTPDDMHIRLAKEFTRIEKRMSPSLNEDTYYNSILAHLYHFKYIVPQGSPMAAIGNPYQLQSLSNCFVIESPSDSIEGIFRTALEMAELQKRRGGVGIDLSTLRPTGSIVNNAALVSTGVPSFSDFYSYITRMIGQKGRNGALMLTLDVEHPDALKFATMKQDMTKVTGANVSFRISDKFMHQVVAGDLKSLKLWDTIIDSAWKTAEPGVLMWDNITKNLPAHNYPGFQTVSTNPCSELPISANDSCRLISMNLFGFVIEPFTPKARFDYLGYEKAVKLGQRMSDGLVELEIEMIDKILAQSRPLSLEHKLWAKIKYSAVSGRRTGLGTHGLADVFLAMNIKYDTDEARYLAESIYEKHRDASYNESAAMAMERGAFPLWNRETDELSEFIQRMSKNSLFRATSCYGRRNISNLTIAPTGSVAIASQTSSGIESVFRWVYDRFVKITHSDMDFPVDRVDANGDKWTKFRVVHHAVKEYFKVQDIECPVKEGRDFLISTDEANELVQQYLPTWFVTSDQINYLKGVELQGAIQQFIDHGISRTINMPKGATREQVSEVYMKAWKVGLKGVTVYVEGSRDGVLVTSSKAESKETRPDTIVDNHAPKRPAKLTADIHSVKVKGKDWGVIVGLFNGRPYEVFAGRGLDLPATKMIESAVIIKAKANKYALEMKIRDNGVDIIKDITEIYDNVSERVISRSVCTALRHGVPVQYIVRDLQDHEGTMMDYSSVLARVLKKYISSGAVITKKCKECGGELAYVEGCEQCKACGSSKCN